MWRRLGWANNELYCRLFRSSDSIQIWNLCSNSLKCHEVGKSTVDRLKWMKNMQKMEFKYYRFSILLKALINGSLNYLFERISSTFGIPIALKNHWSLCAYHKCHQQFLHINRKCIPITLAQFFIKHIQLIADHFTKFTEEEIRYKRKAQQDQCEYHFNWLSALLLKF